MRNAAALGAGALLAVGVSLAGTAIRGDRPCGLPPADRPAFWVVDRDADTAYGLDDRLILGPRARIEHPIDVRATGDGGAWILRSSSPKGPSGLVRLQPDGAIALETSLRGRATLETSGDGDALVIEDAESPSSRLLRVAPAGEVRVLAEEPGLACAVLDRSALVVGWRSGRILRQPLVPDAGGETCASLDGPIVALAAAGGGPELYVLFGGGGERLALLGADLEARWIASSGCRSAGLAPTPDGRHVWVVDIDRPWVRKFSSEGTRELERTAPAFLGAVRAVATEEGGLLVATPGALARVDSAGRTRAGQGGFVFLSGADRIGRD
jgi:hypothetical protein